MPELHGHLTPTGTLGGGLNTIVYASNYNVLSNKPQINNVELTGNKTAADLGLAVPSDITVYSVNEKTGDVELTGADIEYTSGVSLNAKIIDIESQIATSGVLSVNGETGIVSLDANDIPYATGVSTKAKIDSVEQSIPVVDYPVTSVNGETGAVVLDGTDIEYSSGVSVNSKINAVEQSIPVVDYPVTSVNGQTGDVTISVPTNAGELPLGTTTPTGSTAEACIIPSELTITSQNVNLSTNNSKIYRLTNKMIIVYFDFVFSSVSSGWNDLFEFNCSTSFALTPFAAVASSSGTVSAYTQAYYDNGKIKIREQGCNASNTFRGQMIILTV